MDGATVKCQHIDKTGQHKFQPAGSAILQPAPGIMQPLVFGICECGFAIGTTPYIEGATPIAETEEEQKEPNKVLKAFGKGARA